MLKLTAATLAGLYSVALIFGSDAAPEAGRAMADNGFDLKPVSFISQANASVSEAEITGPAPVSDEEAVQLALATGEEMRTDRPSAVLFGVEGALPVIAEAVQAEVPVGPLWKVTGSNVNLRSGPGTANDVVTQLTLGTEAIVTEERGSWIKIETADGATQGWIFAKYLEQV